MRRVGIALLMMMTTSAGLSPAFAQDEGDNAVLKVGISPFAPFVLEEPPPQGYSIDLWEKVAANLGRKFELVRCTGAADKVNRLIAGELDVAIGGLTTTQERETKIDFTHPTYRSGLGIMLAGTAERPALWERVGGALARTNSSVAIAFFAMVFIAGNLIWLIERDRDSFSKAYLPGVFEGMYWAVVTASTVGYGDKAPLKVAGRILAMLLIVISLPLFAVFTAELASAFTLQEISATVRGPSDLVGRRVGVVRGTLSAQFAASQGLEVRQWDRAQEMYQGLRDGKVGAVIYDSPSLKYYAQTDGADSVHMVPGTFEIRDLAIATQQGSTLREQINRALLDLEQTNELSELRVKWLGSD